MASLGPDQSWPRIRDAAAALVTGEIRCGRSIGKSSFPRCSAHVTAVLMPSSATRPFWAEHALSTSTASVCDWLQTLSRWGSRQCRFGGTFLSPRLRLAAAGGLSGVDRHQHHWPGGYARKRVARSCSRGWAPSCRATRRLPWPGEAAVVVSIVHCAAWRRASPILDGRAGAADFVLIWWTVDLTALRCRWRRTRARRSVACFCSASASLSTMRRRRKARPARSARCTGHRQGQSQCGADFPLSGRGGSNSDPHQRIGVGPSISTTFRCGARR